MKITLTFSRIALCALMPVMASAQPLVHRTASETFNALQAGFGSGDIGKAGARNTSGGNACRLVAMTNFDVSTGTLSDSSTYVYSGTRGSYLDMLVGNYSVKPDATQQYVYDATAAAYNPPNISSATYNSGNMPVTSASKDWNTSTAAYWHFKKDTNVYNAAGLLTNYYQYDSATYGSTWVEQENKAFSYTPANRLATLTVQQRNSFSGTMVNYERLSYTYNAAGQKATETREKAVGYTGWENDTRTTYGYDATGKLSRWVQEQYNTVTHLWDSQNIVTRVYDALDNPVEETVTTWNGTTGTWVNANRRLNNMFVSNQPQEIVFQHWNSTAGTWVNYVRYNITYNSFTQPTLLTYQEWDQTAATWVSNSWAPGTRYYYETYETSVQEQAHNNSILNIHPVPATEIVTLHVRVNEPQAFTVTIVDMQGRATTTWSVPACSEYTEYINIGNMPAGNYIVKMEGRTSRAVQQLSVVH